MAELQPSYYESRWSGEEIDRLLGGNTLVITERMDSLTALRGKYPEGRDGYYFTNDTKEVYWWDKTTSEWVSLGNLEGPPGQQGDKGEPGPQGPAGPNTVSTSTATEFNGLLKGNGANVAQAQAGTDYISPQNLADRFGRSDAVTAANTSYEKFMVRGIAAGTAAPQTLENGCIYLVYE